MHRQRWNRTNGLTMNGTERDSDCRRIKLENFLNALPCTSANCIRFASSKHSTKQMNENWMKSFHVFWHCVKFVLPHSYYLLSCIRLNSVGSFKSTDCRLLKLVFRTMLMVVYFHTRDRNGRYLYLINNEKRNERDGKR